MSAPHKLDVGKHVKSSDGKDVGRVDKLVMNPDTLMLHSFVIKGGHLFGHDVIAPLFTVDSVEEDGLVHLNIDAESARQLQPFVREQYYVTPPEDFHVVGGGGFMVKEGNPYMLGPPEGGDRPVPAAVPNHLIHNSSISADMVMLTAGTDVYGSGGDKIGTVDEIIYTDDGHATAFIVKAGHLFHHDVRIPIAWVRLLTSREIHLRVTEEECEKSKAEATAS